MGNIKRCGRGVASQAEQLARLAERVRKHHRYCHRRLVQSIEHALQAGQALLEAKELCCHGEWLPWLKDNCELHSRTAHRYMRFAKLHSQIPDATWIRGLPSMTRLLDDAAKRVSRLKPADEAGVARVTHESVLYSIYACQAGEEPLFVRGSLSSLKAAERAVEKSRPYYRRYRLEIRMSVMRTVVVKSIEPELVNTRRRGRRCNMPD